MTAPPRTNRMRRRLANVVTQAWYMARRDAVEAGRPEPTEAGPGGLPKGWYYGYDSNARLCDSPCRGSSLPIGESHAWFPFERPMDDLETDPTLLRLFWRWCYDRNDYLARQRRALDWYRYYANHSRPTATERRRALNLDDSTRWAGPAAPAKPGESVNDYLARERAELAARIAELNPTEDAP